MNINKGIIILSMLLVLTPFILANPYSFNLYDDVSVDVNGTELNVNNSQYLQGLTPQEVADLSPPTSPAGSDTEIQFNDGGSFGASSDLTWNNSYLEAGNYIDTQNTNNDGGIKAIGSGTGYLDYDNAQIIAHDPTVTNPSTDNGMTDLLIGIESWYHPTGTNGWGFISGKNTEGYNVPFFAFKPRTISGVNYATTLVLSKYFNLAHGSGITSTGTNGGNVQWATMTNDIINLGSYYSHPTYSGGAYSNPLILDYGKDYFGTDLGYLKIRRNGDGVSKETVAEFNADGDFSLTLDNQKLYHGAGGDVSDYYNGTDWIFNSQEVGTGDYYFTGGDVNIENDLNINNLNTNVTNIQDALNIDSVTEPGYEAVYTSTTGGSMAEGTYWYLITYVTDLGETSKSGVETVTVLAGDNAVQITDLPVSTDPRVTGRRIYRTQVGVSSSGTRLLTTVTNNVDTTYLDTSPDSSLGSVSGAGYFRVDSTTNYITLDDGKVMAFGLEDVYMGIDTGNSLTSGGRNTVVGARAGRALTEGKVNTLIGLSAASRLLTGGSNAVIGASGYGLIYGYDNVIIGGNAGYRKDSVRSVLIGSLAGFGGTSGTGDLDYSVIIGNQAGYGAGGSYTTTLGAHAGKYDIGYGNTFVGARASQTGITTGRYNVVLGYGIELDNVAGSYQLNIQDILKGDKTSGSEYLWLPIDNQELYFGAGKDASIKYDGTNLQFTQEVGAGDFIFNDGNMDLTSNDIININQLIAHDGSRIGHGATSIFTEIDQAIVLESNQTLGDGVITHALLDRQGQKVISLWQSGKNDSWQYTRNSGGYFADHGIVNASQLSNANFMWENINVSFALDYYSAGTGADLGVEHGIETQQLFLHNDLGNGLFNGEGKFTWISENETDIDLFGTTHIKAESRMENVTTGVGDVTLFNIGWEGTTIGTLPPPPFIESGAGTGNTNQEWSIRNDARCVSNPCARARGADGGDIRGMDYNDINTTDVTSMTLSFYYGSDNMDGTVGEGFEVLMNNNIGSGWVSIWSDNPVGDVNPSVLKTFSVPVSMENQNNISLRFNHNAGSFWQESFVDEVSINGTAGIPIIIEVERNDALIELGGSHIDPSKCQIYMNDSSDTTYFGNSNECNVILPNTTQITNGFTGSCVNITYSGGIAISCND